MVGLKYECVLNTRKVITNRARGREVAGRGGGRNRTGAVHTTYDVNKFYQSICSFMRMKHFLDLGSKELSSHSSQSDLASNKTKYLSDFHATSYVLKEMASFKIISSFILTCFAFECWFVFTKNVIHRPTFHLRCSKQKHFKLHCFNFQLQARAQTFGWGAKILKSWTKI